MIQTESITKRLEGKIAVITGGSSGIGLATVQRFVEEGAYVFITGRRQSEVDVAVNQIGKNVTGVQGGRFKSKGSRSVVRHGEAAERANRYPLRKRRRYGIRIVRINY
jgi:NAD(P)-dependent dehydrogenase (short-subunit alcohol dehydrogenase family)